MAEYRLYPGLWYLPTPVHLTYRAQRDAGGSSAVSGQVYYCPPQPCSQVPALVPRSWGHCLLRYMETTRVRRWQEGAAEYRRAEAQNTFLDMSLVTVGQGSMRCQRHPHSRAQVGSSRISRKPKGYIWWGRTWSEHVACQHDCTALGSCEVCSSGGNTSGL